MLQHVNAINQYLVKPLALRQHIKKHVDNVWIYKNKKNHSIFSIFDKNEKCVVAFKEKTQALSTLKMIDTDSNYFLCDMCLSNLHEYCDDNKFNLILFYKELNNHETKIKAHKFYHKK